MDKYKLTKAKSEKGFSLLIALLFVAFFGSVLTTFVYNKNGESMQSEAEIAGFQAAKLARAARIYVRDQNFANPNLKFDLDIAAAGPQLVSLNVLAAASLIPDNFLRRDGAGDFNALGQEAFVIMANYPVDGNPNDDSTVPTAYVYFDNGGGRSSSSLVQDMVQAARRYDLALAAPLYEGGVNLSGNCNGMGNAVAIWDSGCMGEVEFTELTGEDFEEGSLLVPAWRSVNFDTRILMRYPQPEMIGNNTMLTELEMGDPRADCASNTASRISIPSDTGEVTELCGAMSDNPAAADVAQANHRRDIIGTRNLSGRSYITERQAGMDVNVDAAGNRTNAAADETYAFAVAGNVTAIGDMKVFDGDMTIGGTSVVDRNILVPTREGETVTANIGNQLNASSMSSTLLEVINRVNTESDISANTSSITPAAVIGNRMVTEQMQMNTEGGTVNVITRADMLGNTDVSDTKIAGTGAAGAFSFVAGNLNAKNMNVNGVVAVADTTVVQGGTNVNGRLDITNGGSAQCFGDCPERIAFCQKQGALSFLECMQVRGW